ncbi:MAG: transposase [Chthonomonadaceae bacterium]|nr:MAG: transposase [Chthonomonadaceae bacterium]
MSSTMGAGHPYLWLDATYVKVRDGSRIVSKAAVVAIGLNEEGRREVLGMRVGHAETEEFWTEFLRSVLDRGLRGTRLVVSDSPRGSRKRSSAAWAASGSAAGCTSCAMCWRGFPKGARRWWPA